MSDKIEELLAKMAEKSDQQNDTIQQQSVQIANLLTALQGMPGVNAPISVTVQPAAQNDAAVRADKIQRLAIGLRKSNKIKDFKHTKESNVRTYIKRFDEEIKSLKVMVGIQDNLSKDEYIPLFRANLEFNVLKRVEQVFKGDPGNLLTWETVTIDNLHKIMIDEFGIKYTDVANVLGQFGPSRLSKSADKSVSEFYYEWFNQIPDIMKPTNNNEYKSFSDLIQRAMFYISLNDKFLQQALSDLKEPNPTLKTYLDEAIAAESRRKCFQDIAVSSSNLDSNGGVTISKWDASYSNSKKSNSKESNFAKGGKPKSCDNYKKPDYTDTQSKNVKETKTSQNQNQNSQNPNKNHYCKECKIK